MKKQLGKSLLAIILILIVVFLGLKSKDNAGYVVGFGLASAFLAPIAMSIIADIFNVKKKFAFSKLLKITEIDNLIQKAETQEEKVQLLQNERKQLIEIIQYETMKYAILERRKILIAEAEKLIVELDNIEIEVKNFNFDEQEKVSNQIIGELYKRLEIRRNIGFATPWEGAINYLFNALPIPSFMSLMIQENFDNLIKNIKNNRKKTINDI